MGKIILVIGGAGSGKSKYAEKICGRITGDHKIYLATMKNDGSKAYEERVKRHRKNRQGKGFVTIEKEKNLSDLSFDGNETVLLEDLTNLLSNIMFSDENFFSKEFEEVKSGASVDMQAVDISTQNSEGGKAENGQEQDFASYVFADILALSYKVQNIVVVMNDVFRDGLCYDESTEKFLEELGKVHRLLAEKAGRVVKVIYGIPLVLKGD